ncbi:hypothetical protein [Nostoc sp.]|uniref:hypothetical protein n=1 Tax=Nostoc sp. TaxID=1180 RepID=UPI002FFA4A2C
MAFIRKTLAGIRRNFQNLPSGSPNGKSFCQRLVELMGGKIWLERPGLGQGNTVTFTLPLNEPSQIRGDSLEHPTG